MGSDWKGKLSPLMYLLGIAIAHWMPGLAQAIYLLVATALAGAGSAHRDRAHGRQDGLAARTVADFR